MKEEILTVIREVLAPMVSADGGTLYVVEAGDDRVVLHLTGKHAGCPGNEVAVRRVIKPALQSVSPDVHLQVTWGHLVPEGARQLEAPFSPSS